MEKHIGLDEFRHIKQRVNMKNDFHGKVLSWISIIIALSSMGAGWYNIYEQNQRAEKNAKEERESTHYKIGIEILMQQMEKFDGKEFRKTRKLAATALLAGKKQDNNVYDVINFFDTMGLLVRRNVLDEEMVMPEFFDYISGYWHATSDYINTSIRLDSLNYKDFIFLDKKMNSAYKFMGGKEELDHQSLKEFLKDESELPIN
jgi:hypothetical protein